MMDEAEIQKRETDSYIEKIKHKIHSFKRKFLLAIDNVRCLNEQDYQSFLKFICDIATNKFKILFESNKFDVTHHSDKFVIKKVEKLRNEVSIDLFIAKIPLAEDDKNAFLDWDKI